MRSVFAKEENRASAMPQRFISRSGFLRMVSINALPLNYECSIPFLIDLLYSTGSFHSFARMRGWLTWIFFTIELPHLQALPLSARCFRSPGFRPSENPPKWRQFKVQFIAPYWLQGCAWVD